MTIEEMKIKKAELSLSNEELARLSGVPFSTVQKIFSGKTESPRLSTVLALEEGFSIAERNRTLEPYNRDEDNGYHTLEDYYALPDERRVELIDGVFYDMAAPSYRHQIILGELYIQFRACADGHEGECRVMLSPCDVQLDNDDKTIVQPDLFVLCGKTDITGLQRFPGAPDLTLEILSESTRSKDVLLKSYKYKNAGVREYWIVDPRNEEILVYDFSKNDLKPKEYSFVDIIPILISDGKCSIDFGKIKKALGE